MGKRKVTLSLDSKVYEDFKKYCDTNAIMLSKSIELFIKNIMKKKKSFFLFFFLFFLFVGNASAATIFSDDFESGNLNSWDLSSAAGANNWTNTNTDPNAGTRHTQSQPQSTSEPASVIQRNVGTTGYQNITLRYYRRLIGLDTADEFQVEWNDGAGWIILEDIPESANDDAAYVFKEFNFSTNADNNANFAIKFECTAGAVSEFCRVDDVSVVGNQIASEDTTPPIVALISPANGAVTTANITFFSASFSDDTNVSNATLYIWNSTSLVGTNFTTLGNSSISANVSFALPRAGTYFWNFLAFDNSSNSAFNSTNFTLIYSPPGISISINSPSNATLSTPTPRLNLSVSGNNIDSVWISLDGGVTNMTYAHRNGTIDFGYLDLMFAEDFDNYADGNNAYPRWINLPWFGTAVTENKTYKLYNETPLIDALAFINSSYFNALDYSGSARVMIPQGYNGSAYLTPRFAGVEWKYEIALDYQFSSININKAVNNSWSQLAARWTGDLGVFVQRGEWHTLGFSAFGNNISAYVDDIFMLNATDSSLSNATFSGFSLISLDDTNSHMAYFDDLELHRKLGYGSHALTVYANDSNGNSNSSIVTFFVNVDTTPPSFSNFAESPANASSYAQGQVYGFNVTINEDVSVASVGIEFNGVNYSAGNISNVYNFSAANLAAETYSYYWWANDSAGNYNASEIHYYTVSKAEQSITPLLNGNNANLAVNYPQQISASFSGANQTAVSISVNGAAVNAGQNYTFGVGSYVINYSAQSAQNYSAFLAYLNLTINLGNSEVNLSLNGAEGDITIQQGAAILLNGTLVRGDNSAALRLYNNGTLINEAAREASNLTTFNDIGLFNITVIYPGSANYSQSAETYFVNVAAPNSAPTVTLNAPLNNSNLSQNFAVLNATVFDLELNNMTVSFYGNGGVLNVSYNVTNQTTLVHNWSNLANGNYNWTVIASDGVSNSTAEYLFFTINKSGQHPTVKIFYPSYASTYFSNESISLNFSAVSSDLSSCWYSTDNGITNISIANCQNTSFDVAGNGVYNLSVYANESVSGLTANASLTFYVNIGNPTVHLLLPTHNNYTNVSQNNFTYIPSSNVSLANCSLWGNFNGSYGINQTSSSLVSGENIFNLNLSDGVYSWAVSCYDTEAKNAITGNRTLTVDLIAPNVTAMELVEGDVASGDVTFKYNVTDASQTTCEFKINSTGSGTIVFSQDVSNCKNIVVTFTTSLGAGAYQSNFVAQDGAGNSQAQQSSFSVSSGSGGSSTGGSSGGATGSFILPLGPRDAQLEIGKLNEIKIRRGTSQALQLNVESRDPGFLNSCKLKFDGAGGEWFSSQEVKALGPGEKFTYNINAAIPQDAETKKYNINFVVECDEGQKSILAVLVVFVNDFEIEIKDYERENNNLIVSYTLTEYAGEWREVSIEYSFLDLDGLQRARGAKKLVLPQSATLEDTLSFELPKDSFGEFQLILTANDGSTIQTASKTIFLPSGRGLLTGLAISDENLRTLSRLGIIVLGAALLFLIWFLVRRAVRKVRKIRGPRYHARLHRASLKITHIKHKYREV